MIQPRGLLTKETNLIRRLLAILTVLATLAIVNAPRAQASASHRWIIEYNQLAKLSSTYQPDITAALGSVIMADTPSMFGQAGTNAEHYTSIESCSDLTITNNYAAKCLSLDDAPPPAGTYALYDPEGWQLTPTWEDQHPCKAMLEAASIIAAHNATAIMSPPGGQKTQNVMECAAKAAAETSGDVMVHLQVQGTESYLSTFMHYVRQDTRWVHAAEPGMTVSFGISTNPKYNATASIMWQAWQDAESFLGGNAPCWLNVIPLKTTEINRADRFLAHIY